MKQIFSALESLITIILVIAGIVGASYNAFREGGWISQGFGKITDAYSNYPLVALGLTVAMFFSYRAWRNATASGGGGKIFALDGLRVHGGRHVLHRPLRHQGRDLIVFTKIK